MGIRERLGIEGLAPVEQLSVFGVSGMWPGVGALALYTSFPIGPLVATPTLLTKDRRYLLTC